MFAGCVEHMAGVQRLEEEEAKRQQAAVEDASMENVDAKKTPGMSGPQSCAEYLASSGLRNESLHRQVERGDGVSAAL